MFQCSQSFWLIKTRRISYFLILQKKDLKQFLHFFFYFLGMVNINPRWLFQMQNKGRSLLFFLFQEANKGFLFWIQNKESVAFFFVFSLKKNFFFFTNAKVPEIEWLPKSILEMLKNVIEDSTKKNFQETCTLHFQAAMHGVILLEQKYQMHQNANFRFSQTKCFFFFTKTFLILF